MVLRFYEDEPGWRATGPWVRLSPRGDLYVGIALARDWPKALTHARLAYDEEEHLLILVPCGDAAPGARKGTAGHYGHLRFSFIMALRFFDLKIDQSCQIVSHWQEGRLHIPWPPGAEQQEPKAEAPSEPPASRREQARGQAMDAALEFEDSVLSPPPAESSAVAAQQGLMDLREIARECKLSIGYLWGLCSQGEFVPATGRRGKANVYRRADVEAWQARRTKTKTAAQAPARDDTRLAPANLAPPLDTSATRSAGDPCCLNCRGYKQPIGLQERICLMEGSMFKGQPTKPRDICERHRFWKAPEGSLPDRPARPLTRATAENKRHWGAKDPRRGARRRVICAVCGHEFASRAEAGTPLPHDAEGHAYVGGRGDRRRPCLGSTKPGQPI